MSTSPSSVSSPLISKGCFDQSAYDSSLHWFRRLLATLNWRLLEVKPVAKSEIQVGHG